VPHPLLATAVSVGFETLRANPLRTLLSTLGIVIGVAALVSVLSVGDGMERFARREIARTTDVQSIVVSPRIFRMIDGERFPQTDPIKLSPADAMHLQQALASTMTVNLTVSGSSLVTIPRDSTPHAAQVTGMLVPDERLGDSALVAGRFFTRDEGRSGAPVAVVSQRLADDLTAGKPASEAVGDTLLFQGQPRTVVGVMKQLEPDRARRAFMPESAANAVIVPALVGRAATMVVRVSRVEDVSVARKQIEQWALDRFGRSWSDRLTVVANEMRVEQLERGLLLFKLFMGALMSISLIVGGIGIMNVLLSSVIERTREIGIRKAAGAAHRHILWQFLSESVVITGVGSVIGLALGVGAAFIVTAVMRGVANMPVHAWLSVSTVAVAIGASVIVGLTFGLYPALRAARLSPIDAMHHE